jgi:hypothetical protein
MHFGRLEELVSNITCGLSDPPEDAGIHDEVLGQTLLSCDLAKNNKNIFSEVGQKYTKKR